MISIIICSRDADYLRKVSENVAATIGVPYEIQAIDNSKGAYGICEAYNLGRRYIREAGDRHPKSGAVLPREYAGLPAASA